MDIWEQSTLQFGAWRYKRRMYFQGETQRNFPTLLKKTITPSETNIGDKSPVRKCCYISHSLFETIFVLFSISLKSILDLSSWVLLIEYRMVFLTCMDSTPRKVKYLNLNELKKCGLKNRMNDTVTSLLLLLRPLPYSNFFRSHASVPAW